jgi:glycosyltransferase involved in cell wall biosynthesis
LIKNNIDGLLFKNEDATDLAQKIIYIYENQERYCDLTRNAYLKLQKEFGIEKLSDNLAEAFKKIYERN